MAGEKIRVGLIGANVNRGWGLAPISPLFWPCQSMS
jgi:hypothetical protein